MDVSTKDLLPIGRFSRLTGLTVKALRHYDELGLLEPAHVDGESGYRFYRRSQLREAAAVRRLRALALPLEQIRAIVGEQDADEVRRRLIAHRATIEQRAADVKRILDELTALIDGEEELVPGTPDVVPEMQLKTFPDQPVLSIGERVPTDELKHVIPKAYKAIFEYLRALGRDYAIDHTITVCPFPDEDGFVEIENAVPVPEPVAGRGDIQARTLPGCTAISLIHKGPYEELGRSYTVLSAWIDEQGLETAGPPRELYWTDPEETPDPADYVTEIAWPIVADREKLARLPSPQRLAGA